MNHATLHYPLLIFLIGGCFYLSCQSESESQQTDTPMPKLEKAPFGEVNGTPIDIYHISFPDGLQASVTNYGCILTSLSVPDNTGKLEDIVLGYDSITGYLQETPYFGAVVGRYGNRIANGTFNLQGDTYELATNDGPNHLHGGETGFDKVIWEVATAVETEDKVTLKFGYVSKAGEEGYPGTLNTTVTYTFAKDRWNIAYEATTDQPTIVNLTQHTYFNLSGNLKENILDHVAQLDASFYLPVDTGLIPTGELRAVEGTPFDFTEPKRIGEEINVQNQQLQFGGGYDHCWVLDSTYQEVLAREEGANVGTSAYKVGSVYHEGSGRLLEVYTQQPGVQFYTGNFLDGSITGKGGKVYLQRSGFCLETQHFPDSPNQKAFPSVVLEPGDTYQTETTYVFGVKVM